MWEVYDWITKNGPTVGNDIPFDGGWKIPSQLMKRGVVKEVGEGISKKTGLKGILWDVTDKIPTKMFKTVLEQKLFDLGFKSLEEYYNSEHWKIFRAGYYARHPEARCWITGISVNLDLHHIRYDNLGCEKDEDIVVLCRHMHEKVHKIVKELKVPLNKAHLVIAEIVGRKEPMVKSEVKEVLDRLDYYNKNNKIYATLMSFIIKELGALRPLLEWLRKTEPK